MPADTGNINERHARRMKRKKELVDEKIRQADRDKGLILIHTGNGKGKSSAAFGLAARALGHDMKVGIVQFIKGANSTGEEAFLRRFPDQVDYHVTGEGFTWETQDRELDMATARQAWQTACGMLENPDYGLVILDELNIVLKYNYLSLDNVIPALTNRPAMQHVVITGRGAKPALIEIADTVSEIQDIKHAFRAGVRAQPGIEW